MVKATPENWWFIRELRLELSASFLDQTFFTSEDHNKFMHKHHERYWICQNDDNLFGWIGVVEGDIRLAVAKEWQGTGIGTYMIQWLMHNYNGEMYAIIKPTNSASRAAFKKAGFTKENYLLEP